MRDPENVLNSLQEHSAQSGYVYDRLYRNLFNRDFFLQAYQNIYASQGNMTAGTDGKTIDAMSLERIDRLIAALRDESYQPKPSRRTYIPKKNGKLRPLGIPSIDDKLVQEVVRMLLESIYENSFEDTSHGFRPDRSCHTALRMIQNRFTRCKWFVEGDIKGFFDNIDHNVMIGILRKRIKDERFLRLIRKFLNAGYMEDNQLHQSYSGTPQGGIISPILANIYLDQFDKYMAEYKKRFDRGDKRAVNVEYRKLSDKRIRLKRKLAKTQSEEEKQSLLESIRELDRVHKSIPCKNPMDANFRRMQYVRYADDFLIGIIGAKEDAQAVKQEIGAYIAEQLKLELSDEKTLVTKATDRAKFLGFEIRVTPQSNHTKKTKSGSTARNYSGHVMLEVPTSAIQKKLLELGAMRIDVRNGTEIWQPTHRGKLVGRTDLSILDQYNGEIRGFCNYYGKDSGIAERWGICTQLSADGIEEKYGEIVDRYRPYLVIPRGKTNPFAEYHTNEEKFKKRLFRDDAYGFNDLTEYYHPELVMDLESELELKMFCSHIYDCLPKLTEKQRRVFSLRYSAQLSIGEIAEKQNLTRQAVYALLRGAKNRIREALSHKYPPEFFDGVEKGRAVRG